MTFEKRELDKVHRRVSSIYHIFFGYIICEVPNLELAASACIDIPRKLLQQNKVRHCAILTMMHWFSYYMMFLAVEGPTIGSTRTHHYSNIPLVFHSH